jgi:hypothetical protein
MGLETLDPIERIARFAAAHGWPGAAIAPLAADASFRRYFRIRQGERRAVAMDAPPAKEDIRPFVRLARHLTALGYSAPRVLAADEAAGLALLEDLGDDTFTRLLAAGADEAALYALATDLLIDLHRRPAAEAVPAWLPPYDDRKLLDEAALLPDWFLPAVGIAVAAEAREAFVASWRAALPEARRVTETLVLRDYHVDNLMRIEGRPGIAACGLLDFQDAVAGPVTYDLVSLLEDARRDLAQSLASAMIARYRAAFPALDGAAFEASYAVLGAQRHAKVIGIFTRLSVRDGKPGYLAHIPRVWRLFERALAHPALAPVAGWLDRHVPAAARRAPVRPAA